MSVDDEFTDSVAMSQQVIVFIASKMKPDIDADVRKAVLIRRIRCKPNLLRKPPLPAPQVRPMHLLMTPRETGSASLLKLAVK